MSAREPNLILFVENEIVTYTCFSCGTVEQRFCTTDRKFKSFIKTQTTNQLCNVCTSESNLFRNPHGQQYWINN